MDEVLRLDGVSFVYGEGTPFRKVALDNVSVSFERGKITGLIGHTGSGKSTLVNLLNGINKPTAGKVYLSGEDIWAKPKEIAKIRYRVGLVMQYPEYQLFDETVREAFLQFLEQHTLFVQCRDRFRYSTYMLQQLTGSV